MRTRKSIMDQLSNEGNVSRNMLGDTARGVFLIPNAILGVISASLTTASVVGKHVRESDNDLIHSLRNPKSAIIKGHHVTDVLLDELVAVMKDDDDDLSV
jgi:hypothetical protein